MKEQTQNKESSAGRIKTIPMEHNSQNIIYFILERFGQFFMKDKSGFFRFNLFEKIKHPHWSYASMPCIP